VLGICTRAQRRGFNLQADHHRAIYPAPNGGPSTIARGLALSEGTLKAHVRNIMKKMGSQIVPKLPVAPRLLRPSGPT
jgi:hypothetical protein